MQENTYIGKYTIHIYRAVGALLNSLYIKIKKE
jgi:hypothetical protein